MNTVALTIQCLVNYILETKPPDFHKTFKATQANK